MMKRGTKSTAVGGGGSGGEAQAAEEDTLSKPTKSPSNTRNRRHRPLFCPAIYSWIVAAPAWKRVVL
uniref:Uncharacterized protein n=1 Tax=Cucumis melo TaxID=3656 RepID=A0A9I9DJW2_CUCME